MRTLVAHSEALEWRKGLTEPKQRGMTHPSRVVTGWQAANRDVCAAGHWRLKSGFGKLSNLDLSGAWGGWGESRFAKLARSDLPGLGAGISNRKFWPVRGDLNDLPDNARARAHWLPQCPCD